MPFKGEFYYFYLHLKEYLKNKHKIECSRADTTITGQAFIEKIKDYIKNAEIIIADGTGGNPNVYYELAIAHGEGKKVIHITQDNSNNIPSDTRHIDYIIYRFDAEKEFHKNIDIAIEYAFKGIYEECYEVGKKILEKFIGKSGLSLSLESKREFIKKIKNKEISSKIPKPTPNFDFSNFVFDIIVKDENIQGKTEFTKWLIDNN